MSLQYTDQQDEDYNDSDSLAPREMRYESTHTARFSEGPINTDDAGQSLNIDSAYIQTNTVNLVPSDFDFSTERKGPFFYVTVILLVLFLIAMAIIGWNYLALLVLAVLPAVLIILALFLLKGGSKKLSVDLSCKVLWTGALCVIPVAIVEYILNFNIPASSAAWIVFGAAYKSFVIAGMTEEGAKFLSVLLNNKYKPSYFNTPRAILSYAAIAALGFATIENIGYVVGLEYLRVNHERLNITLPDGQELTLATVYVTAVIRAFLSIPLHTFCTTLAGIGMAKRQLLSLSAYQSSAGFVRILMFPIVIHGLFDFVLMTADGLQKEVLVTISYVFCGVLVFGTAGLLVVQIKELHRKWLGHQATVADFNMSEQVHPL